MWQKADQRNDTETQSKLTFRWCKVRPKELEACYRSIALVCHVPPSICKLQRNPASETHNSKWTAPPHDFGIDHNHRFAVSPMLQTLHVQTWFAKPTLDPLSFFQT